jgi:hypothetical protein
MNTSAIRNICNENGSRAEFFFCVESALEWEPSFLRFLYFSFRLGLLGLLQLLVVGSVLYNRYVRYINTWRVSYVHIRYFGNIALLKNEKLRL